jgi:Cellulase (glycosyl hydrolase family 5)
VGLSALHVDSTGIIRDSNNTQMFLRGLNTAGTEYGSGLGSYLTGSDIMAVSKACSVNLWRLSVNTSWWTNNVLMTDGVTRYQTWINTLIAWMEAANCYVEIDPTTMFCALPSAGVSQSYVDSCNNTEALVIGAAQSFFTSFIPAHASDPAILYNALNEPGNGQENSQVPDADIVSTNQTLITTIRGITSTALIIVYANNYGSVVGGSAPDYTGGNIVLDQHVYDDPANPWYNKMYTDSFSLGLTNLQYAQAHGHGVMVGEFNVNGAWNPTGFAAEVVRRAFKYGSACSYYNSANLISTDSPFTLSTQGQIIASVYAQIAARQKGWFGS